MACILREKDMAEMGSCWGREGGCMEGTIASSCASVAGKNCAPAATVLEEEEPEATSALSTTGVCRPAALCAAAAAVGAITVSITAPSFLLDLAASLSVSDASVPDCAPPLVCLDSLLRALVTISSRDATLPGLSKNKGNA